MGISVHQEDHSQDPNNVQDPPLTGSEPNPPVPPTPPTPNPSDRSIDPAFVSLMQETIREQNRQIGEMQRELTAGRNAPPAPPVRTDDEIRQEFFNNPEAANRRIVREELQATIAPLLDFVKQTKTVTRIDSLVDSYKNNDRFKSHWTPELESYIREQAATVDPDRLNDTTFQFLVTSALGLQVAGMIRGSAPAPTPTPAPTHQNNMPVPPHMRPSPPPGPTNNRPPNDAPSRPLNENEKRLLREYNASKPKDRQMTEKQYIEWQEMDSGDVAYTQFDRPRA